jgi:hypothetical protein
MSFFKNLFGRKAVGDTAPPQPPPLAPDGSPDQLERAIGGVLAKLETKLRSERNSSLPTVTLSIRDTPLGRYIVWCYRKTYQTPATLNVAAAESVLNEELKAINIAVKSSDYMGGQGGEANQLFTYMTRPSGGRGANEEKVLLFDKMDRKQKVQKAADLMAQGQVDLLVAWLHYGKYYGIPAQVLQKASHEGAAQALLGLLKDPAPEARMRAAAALGPLGGEGAAQNLCAALPEVKSMEQYFEFAGALGRLAWPGAVEPIYAAMERSRDPNVRAALAGALVRCGDVERGLNTLYAGFSDSRFPEAYVGTISDLDKEGIRDSRLVPEMVKLLDHAGTGNNNSNQIANDVISRHKDEWEETRKHKYAPPVRHAPTMTVKPFSGDTMYPIEKASAITGIPVDEIHKLIRDRRVFALGTDVALYGKVPCGELVDDPDPRRRGIGAMPRD